MTHATSPLLRWSASALAALLVHGLAAAWLLRRPPPAADAGAVPAAILIDLAPARAPPATSAPAVPESSPARPRETSPVAVRERAAAVAPSARDAPKPAAETREPEPPAPAAEAEAEPAKDASDPTPASPAASAGMTPATSQTSDPTATTATRRYTASGRTSAEAAWQSRLLGHLEGFRRYPLRALRQRQEGVTYLRFSVDRHGAVTAVRLERGSGSEALDAEALDVVRRAQPVPAPPLEIEGDPVEVVVPVQFRLRRR